MCLAVPGQILSIEDDQLRTGTVLFGGAQKEVSLVMVPDANVGDYVIVHVGFAISKLDEEAARSTLDAFAAMGQEEGDFSPKNTPQDPL